jgi:tetratricopeptide (TPR) repeat protein
LIIGLNKFFFEFSGTLFGIEFKVASGTTDTIVTGALILLAGFCLLLDFLQQNDKLKGTLFDFSSKKNKKGSIDITGDGNVVIFNQSDGTVKTKEQIVESYVSPQDEKIKILEQRLKDKQKIEDLLDKENLELSTALAKEKQEKQRLQHEVENILKSKEDKDFTKTPETYQKAFELFSNGKLQEALLELDDAKLKAREQKTSESRKEEAELRILKAQLLRVEHNYKEAGENYEKAVQLYESYNNCLEAASYFYFLNKPKKAIYYCIKCLNKVTKEEQKAIILNNLGILQRAQNEYGKASASYEEALSIYRSLAAENPQTYIPNVGVTLKNMAVFYQDDKVDKELSMQYVDEAITILLPFQEIGYIQNYLQRAFLVLQDWNIDVETYLHEKFPNNEEE